MDHLIDQLAILIEGDEDDLGHAPAFASAGCLGCEG